MHAGVCALYAHGSQSTVSYHLAPSTGFETGSLTDLEPANQSRPAAQ